jgi:hypothetical protein
VNSAFLKERRIRKMNRASEITTFSMQKLKIHVSVTIISKLTGFMRKVHAT